MLVKRWFASVVHPMQHSKWARFTALSLMIVGFCFSHNFSKPTNFPGVPKAYHELTNEAAESDTLDVLSASASSVQMSGDEVPHKPIKQEFLDVLITFTKAEHNRNLQDKFRTTVKSLFNFATIPVNLHILGDLQSERVATTIVSKEAKKDQYKIVHLDIDRLEAEVYQVISDMQKFFSSKLYSDALFFMSLAIHRLLPDHNRIVMLDADLKFNADIKHLFEMFNDFSDENIIGLARECQPVYRSTFDRYRHRHNDTRVGEPPPDGLTGFNSGVILLDLDRMRNSRLYNSLLRDEGIKKLTKKYKFNGHLGDQDFFTLISLEHEHLFYILPCTWNRQLCDLWRDESHGVTEVFDLYFKCEGHINIYHGNCNTRIPTLHWEVGNNWYDIMVKVSLGGMT